MEFLTRGEIDLRAYWNPYRLTVDLVARRQMDLQRIAIPGPLDWQVVEDGVQVQPMLSIEKEDAQVLMNTLWDCGLRPAQGHGSAGQLQATSDHLGDMRMIAGAALAKLGVKPKGLS